MYSNIDGTNKAIYFNTFLAVFLNASDKTQSIQVKVLHLAGLNYHLTHPSQVPTR